MRKRYDAQSLTIEHMELLRMDYESLGRRYEADGRTEAAEDCKKQAERWNKRQRDYQRKVMV